MSDYLTIYMTTLRSDTCIYNKHRREKRSSSTAGFFYTLMIGLPVFLQSGQYAPKNADAPKTATAFKTRENISTTLKRLSAAGKSTAA